MQPGAPDRRWSSLVDPGNADDLFQFPIPRLPLTSDRFDRSAALLLAELSRMVYQIAPDRRRVALGQAGLIEASFLELGPVGAGLYVAAAGGLGTALVFRGTASIGGWFTNLNFRAAPSSIGGRVHRGFLDAWLAASPTVHACAASLPRPLSVAGHSLGGALALLATLDLEADLTYTFGAPKVGDIDLQRAFAGRPCYRVVHGRDVVPTLPPGSVYRHAGKPRRIGLPLSRRAGATLREAAGALRTGRFVELQRTLREAPEPLSDHAPVNYVRALIDPIVSP